jgi:hypothetical protein
MQQQQLVIAAIRALLLPVYGCLQCELFLRRIHDATHATSAADASMIFS